MRNLILFALAGLFFSASAYGKCDQRKALLEYNCDSSQGNVNVIYRCSHKHITWNRNKNVYGIYVTSRVGNYVMRSEDSYCLGYVDCSYAKRDSRGLKGYSRRKDNKTVRVGRLTINGNSGVYERSVRKGRQVIKMDSIPLSDCQQVRR